MNAKRFRAIIYVLFFLNLIVITSYWWNASGGLFANATPGGEEIALGRYCGLLAEYLILIELILIGRIAWIERLFPYDKTLKIHRYVGIPLAITILLHPFLLVLGYGAKTQSAFLPQLLSFIRDWEDVGRATLGFFCFIVALVTSVFWIRRKLRYGVWHGIHLLMYVGIVLAFAHQLGGGDFVGTNLVAYWICLNFLVFGIFLAFRFVRPLYLFNKHRFRVHRAERDSGGVTHVAITGERMDEFDFAAGQFANINFLQRGLWGSHPFSFSAAKNGKTIRFSIKNLGDHTAKVSELVPGTPVIIDGPHGNFVFRSATRDKFLLVAGGIGITPILAMLDELHGQTRDVVVLFAAHDEDTIPCEKELRAALEFCHGVTCKIVLRTPPKTPDALYGVGRIDHSLISKEAPDFIDREVFVCGPPRMTEEIVSDLKTRGMPTAHLHFEKFTY